MEISWVFDLSWKERILQNSGVIGAGWALSAKEQWVDTSVLTGWLNESQRMAQVLITSVASFPCRNLLNFSDSNFLFEILISLKHGLLILRSAIWHVELSRVRLRLIVEHELVHWGHRWQWSRCLVLQLILVEVSRLWCKLLLLGCLGSEAWLADVLVAGLTEAV